MAQATNSPAPEISDEVAELVIHALLLYVTPSVALLGMAGNVMTIMIFCKRGLRKSSDILLFCLALADLSYLVGICAYLLIGYLDVMKYTTQLPYIASYSMFIVYLIVHWICDVSSVGSVTIPVLITLDRVIAIFFPLHVYKIVTCRKTWSLVIAIAVFFSALEIYLELGLQFRLRTGSSNISFWDLTASTIQLNRADVYESMSSLISHLSGTVPVVLVSTGTVFIGVKIRLVSTARKKLTGGTKKDATASKTTRTLLSVCILFSINAGFAVLNGCFNPNVTNLDRVIQGLRNPILCLNSSCNYLIYVATNKNFKLSNVRSRVKLKKNKLINQ